MHLILYLLFIMTIIIKISGNRMIRDRRIKSQNSPKYFSHDDDFGRFRKVREVQNLQDDLKKNRAPMAHRDLLQDLDDEKLHHQIFSLQDNVERENPLRKRTLSKKKRHRKGKRKRKKLIKGRKKGSKKHSRRRERNEMHVSNYQPGSRIERQNHYYPKKFIKKQTRPQTKIFSPYNDVIEYLKSGKHSNLDNSEIFETKNSDDRKRQRLSNHALKEREQNKIKRSPPPDFGRKNNINSQAEECENNCENENLEERYCSCKNGKAVDFEKQLKILNKGGEEVQTTKEKPGILNGIKNFLKQSLKNKEENCSLVTTTFSSHPYRCQNQNCIQDTTFSEASTVTSSETNNEANSEANSEVNSEMNTKSSSETTTSTINRATNIATRKTIIELEDNTESFTEEISTNPHIETSTLVTTTTEKEEIYPDLRRTIELNNKDSITTPLPYNLWSEKDKDDVDSRDNLPDNKKCKEPFASFTLEIKANPSAKKKSFRIKMKY